MKVVFIGAGNLATCLSSALKEHGTDIVQIFSRTEESASALARKIGCRWTVSYGGIDRNADMYVISVSDAAIDRVLENISSLNTEALFCHTAGSVPMCVFEKYRFVRYGVLYPMQTFSKQKAVDFSAVPFFIEASDGLSLETLRQVASSLSRKVIVADSSARKALHISAVFACNFANHMYDISAHLLARHGIPFDVMLPLVDETAAKVHSVSPHEAQTGPAVRNDKNVMENHLEMLGDEPELQDIYRIMSKNINRWAR